MKAIIMSIVAVILVIVSMEVCITEKTLANTGEATVSVRIRVMEIAILGLSDGMETFALPIDEIGEENLGNYIDSGIYLHYTSTVKQGTTRNIAVQSLSEIPSGITVNLLVEPSGRKNEGISASAVKLSPISQNIVSGIGSCATGTSPTSGAKIKYKVDLNNVQGLEQIESEPITVIFTITRAD